MPPSDIHEVARDSDGNSWPATLSPALPFEDLQFCVAAQQLAVAADKDIGIWVDRVTRNAGMSVACDRKLVEFDAICLHRISFHDGRLESR